MRRVRIVLLAVAVVGTALAAWWVTRPTESSRPRVDVRAGYDAAATHLAGESQDTRRSRSDGTAPDAAQAAAGDASTGSVEAARQSDRPGSGSRPLPPVSGTPDTPRAGDLPPPPGSGPVPATPQADGASASDAAATVPAAPPGLPTPARVPTPRERAEQARYAGGSNLPKAEAIPKVVAAEVELPPLDMARLAEPEIWAEYWAREGYAAPAMIKTPVRGKLMARLAQKGVEGARLRLFTFFPANGQLGGPVLPVMMEAVSDAGGFFTANLPVPEKWPTGYAKLALSVEAEGLRLVDALIVPDLRPGEHNEIGVFWAPEEPYEVDVKVTAARTGLAVAVTGRLDPRRWENKRAAQVFGWFSRVPVGGAGAKLQGTWDILADPPFVTLLEHGAPVMTQRLVHIAQPSDGAMEADHPDGLSKVGKPFQPVVFANDGYIALTGRVVAPDDMPVAGATVTLKGDGDPRVAFSDASGFFLFGGLRDRVISLRAEHADFVAADSDPMPSATSDFVLKFEYHRPRVNLTVTRADTSQPVTALWFSVNQLGGPPVHLRAASAAGVYAFEWDKPVLVLHILAPGLLPRAVTFGQTEQALSLEPGLPLSRRPRDYDAASWPEGWQTVGETPCLWSLDDDHWVEYRFNFGQTEAPFVLELGVKNHTYAALPLDNEYLFEVEVYLDGRHRATLSIPSDAQVPKHVLLALGTLSGEHTIRLKWINDRWIPGQLDANISYESIELFQAAP